MQPVTTHNSSLDLPAVPLRLCKVCKEEKPVSEFRIGPSGRMKTICGECTDAIILACLGAGLRRCTTCGRPTANYRCSSCWAKIRGSGNTGIGLDPNYLP